MTEALLARLDREIARQNEEWRRYNPADNQSWEERRPPLVWRVHYSNVVYLPTRSAHDVETTIRYARGWAEVLATGELTSLGSGRWDTYGFLSFIAKREKLTGWTNVEVNHRTNYSQPVALDDLQRLARLVIRELLDRLDRDRQRSAHGQRKRRQMRKRSLARACARCDTPLPTGAHARQRFCSSACRVAGFRARGAGSD